MVLTWSRPFTAVSYEAAMLDLWSEEKYTELMHLHPEFGRSNAMEIDASK